MVYIFINIIINIYWYFMKLFIHIYDFFSKIAFSIQNCYSNYFPIKESVIIIKDSKIKYICNDDLSSLKDDDHNYVIYNEYYNDKRLSRLVNRIQDISLLKNKMVPCKFEFIFVLIKTDTDSYDITTFLKNNKEYYYVCDALLFNKNFMNWIFINFIKKNIDNYKIVFLDNKCKEIIINENQHIKLYESTYEILSSTHLI